MKEKLKSNSK